MSFLPAAGHTGQHTPLEEDVMGTVLVSSAVSLDGFSAGSDVTVQEPMGVGGEGLHTWMFNEPDEHSKRVIDELNACGAVVLGRRTYDLGVDIWGDVPFPVDSFVVTHRAQDERVAKSGTFTFVTDGVASAIEQAQAVAGDKNVLVMGGAEIISQVVRAGLADEILISLVPVLLGAGSRLLLDAGHAELEQVSVLETPRVTHIRYRVVR
jgi:dihydrofolate reductase